MLLVNLLALVDLEDNADSMAAASPLYELTKVFPQILIVATTSGLRGYPLVTTAAAPRFLTLY